MRVISQKDLEGKGATSRSAQLRKPRSKIASAPPKIEVAAPEVNIDAPEINIDLSPLFESNSEVVSSIKEMLKAQKSAKRPTEWEFIFNRNDQGFVQSITAKAK